MDEQNARVLFERLRAADPTPRTALTYSTAFELLIAVILSAQATDRSVNRVTTRLFAVANTPQALLDLGEATLREYIRTIGLFNTKARNIRKTCARLLAEYGGAVPDTREALESLPGVGRKTANIILNTVFGHPTLAVDTHIFRLANRTGLASGTTPLAVERQVVAKTPREFRRNAHHWLVRHGRTVCTARKPRCPDCLLSDLCEYGEKTPA